MAAHSTVFIGNFLSVQNSKYGMSAQAAYYVIMRCIHPPL